MYDPVVGIEKRRCGFSVRGYYALRATYGGRSSKVEFLVVVQAVVGSNPIDHPRIGFFK